MKLLLPSFTEEWIFNKVQFFTVFELYSDYYIIAFAVRFSNLLFWDIWRSFSTQNNPLILKNYPLIVTFIVYQVLNVCVHSGNNNIE